MTRFFVFFTIMKLQKVKNNGMYRIEKISKSQTRKGKMQLLVHWVGYNSDFDCWIVAEDVHNV